MIYHQTGDLLYIKERKLPKGKAIKSGVILKSTQTGHAHVVKGGQLRQDANGTMFIKVEEQATLHHEEHKTLTIPKGFYRVQVVKEYDHFFEESRNVVD